MKRSRGNNSEIKQLGKRADNLIEAGDNFLDSQKGLKNFKTDEIKKNDPFLVEFYEYHNKFVTDIKRTIDEPQYAETYFKVQGDFFGNFTIVVSKVVQRANEIAVEITTLKIEQ